MINYNLRSLRRFVASGLISFLSISGYAHASTDQGADLLNGTAANAQAVVQADAGVPMQSLKSEGTIEVRFRDTNHLKSIIQTIPSIDANELYFIKDPAADARSDLAYLKDGVVRKDCEQILGKGSDFFQQAQALIGFLDSFNPFLFSLRTEDAKLLMQQRTQSRQRSPDMYPSFDEMCPDLYWACRGQIEMTQGDYIDGVDGVNQHIAYMASSSDSLTQLIKDLPGPLRYIRYIDAELPHAGIYSAQPLRIVKKHVIRCDGDLALTGIIFLPDHALDIVAKDNLWLIGHRTVVGPYISLVTRGYLLNSGLIEPFNAFQESGTLPKNMNLATWQMLLKFWIAKGLMSIK